MTLPRTLARAYRSLPLAVMLVLTLFPILWIVLTSMKVPRDIFTNRLLFEPTLANYTQLFSESSNFVRYLLNSAVVALFSTVTGLLAAAPAAYSVSRFTFPWNLGRMLLGFLLFTRIVFPIALAIPFYGLIHALGLYDSIASLMIVHATVNVPFAVWILKTYFDGFPVSIEEAAKMDGCTTLQTLRYIVLPLSAPTLAAAGTFMFILSWNDYLFASVITATPAAMTMPVALANFVQENIVQWGQMSAAATVVIVPVFLFTLLVQEQFIKGFTMGSTKG